MKRYYVTMIDGKRFVRLLGPYDSHADAIKYIDDARRYVTTTYPRYWFCEFGTCSDIAYNAPGKLNDLGLF